MIPNEIPEENNDPNIFTTIKAVNKFKHSLSIKDLEKTTSNDPSEKYIENIDQLNHYILKDLN